MCLCYIGVSVISTSRLKRTQANLPSIANFHFMLPNNIEAAEGLNRNDCVMAASLRFMVTEPRFDVVDTHFL